jgi:hypothetical protein
MPPTASPDSTVSPALRGPLSSGALYLGPNTHLRITAFNAAASVRLALQGLVMQLSGEVTPFRHELAPTTDRVITTQSFAMTEGWLLSADLVAVSGSPRRGQCWARVQFTFGRNGVADAFGTVLQGYITDTAGLSLNGSLIGSSADGPGVIRSITGTDPAAGVEISETVPTNARWRVFGVAATLVTDATVANREAALVLDDGTTVNSRSPSRFNHAASLTRLYSFAPQHRIVAVATDTTQTPPMPDAILMGGARVRTITTNLQAGDNWSAPQLLVEEWIED